MEQVKTSLHIKIFYEKVEGNKKETLHINVPINTVYPMYSGFKIVSAETEIIKEEKFLIHGEN